MARMITDIRIETNGLFFRVQDPNIQIIGCKQPVPLDTYCFPWNIVYAY